MDSVKIIFRDIECEIPKSDLDFFLKKGAKEVLKKQKNNSEQEDLQSQKPITKRRTKKTTIN